MIRRDVGMHRADVSIHALILRFNDRFSVMTRMDVFHDDLLVFPSLFHEIGLHVLFLNVGNVSFSLLPPCIALVAYGLPVLYLLRAGARRLGEDAMIAGLSKAAIVLPFLRKL